MADRQPPTAEQIRAVWEELDRPGPEKLQVALRKRGYFAPSVQVLREHFFKFQSSRQVFRHPPKYTGHIYSEGMDRRWQADIMQMPEAEHGGETYKYALVAVDVFSRYAWAALIASPMSAVEGYREILHRAGAAPTLLLTDGDPAFQTPAFKKALGSTYHELKSGAQDLAVVDRLIGLLKRKQKQAELDGEKPNWAARLQQGVTGFNRSGAPALHESAPEDLRGPGGEIRNKELYFDRKWDESKAMEANAAAIHRRAENLQGTEAFRTLAPFPGPKRRIGDPVWNLSLHSVKEVSGATVEDERGERFLTKEVLPIHKESTELTTPAPKLNAKARGMLQRYADRGKAFLLGQPEHRANATRFYNALASEGNVKEALRLAGVATDAVVRSVARLFPDTFRLETGKGGGAAHVALVA
jgi:transposase InsO family protein